MQEHKDTGFKNNVLPKFPTIAFNLPRIIREKKLPKNSGNLIFPEFTHTKFFSYISTKPNCEFAASRLVQPLRQGGYYSRLHSTLHEATLRESMQTTPDIHLGKKPKQYNEIINKELCVLTLWRLIEAKSFSRLSPFALLVLKVLKETTASIF